MTPASSSSAAPSRPGVSPPVGDARPLALLLINYEYPPLGGGAANATQALAGQFAALGHRVTVLTSRFRDQPAVEETDGFVVHRIPVWRRSLDKCSPPEMLTFLASGMRRVAGLVASSPPDIALAFFGLPSGPVAWWLRKRMGVPYVIALRGGDVPGAGGKEMVVYHALTRPVIRRLWREAAAVVANSQGLARLARLTIPDHPFAVIPNGVDMARFASAEAKARDPEAPVRLLFVGRIAKEKALHVLLEALAKINRHRPEIAWELEMVGDGPERLSLEALAGRLGIGERIAWRGWLLKEDIPEVYRRTDLFVFPSIGEGMPNAVLEAMAAGVPVVAARARGTDEVVVDGETGLLTPVGDAEALAEALERALSDSAWRAAMARGALARARRFSWRAMAETYIALFHRLLEERKDERT